MIDNTAQRTVTVPAAPLDLLVQGEWADTHPDHADDIATDQTRARRGAGESVTIVAAPATLAALHREARRVAAEMDGVDNEDPRSVRILAARLAAVLSAREMS